MPRELSTTETALWRDRLRYSDEVWKRAGLHDQSPVETHAKRWMDYYRGDQADGIGYRGIDRGLGVIENVMFSTLNALVASLYARNPRTDVMADRPDRKTAAERMERVVNFLVASPRLRIRRELNRVLWDAAMLKFGIARHGFTMPEEKQDSRGNLLETYDGKRPHFPWIERTAPWDFRCDALAATLHPEHASWCAFRDLYPLATIRKSPAFIARDDLRPTRSMNDAKFHDSRRRNLSPDENDLVEVWTVYDKVKRETFRLSPGSDRAISKVNEWPIPWRTLPYSVLQFNPTPDDPMGVSFSELVGPLQDDLNRTRTLTLELAKRQRRMVFVNPDLLIDGEADKLENMSLMEIILARDVNNAAREVQVGGGYQELLLLSAQIKDSIRSLIGVGEMERGQRINVETAAEATQVGAGAALQRGRNQGPFEDFLADAIETFSRGVQATATQPIVVPILGSEGASDLFASAEGVSFDEVQPEEIQGEFQYRIRPGSTMPHDPNEEARKMLALTSALQPFGELVNLPQAAIDIILAFEKDPAKLLNTQSQLQAQVAQRAQQPMTEDGPPGQQTPQGGGVDAQLASLLQSGGRIQ